MSEPAVGHYYWIKLKSANFTIWEPAYRFRGAGHKDVWLVICSAEDVGDDKVEQVGPKLEPPSHW